VVGVADRRLARAVDRHRQRLLQRGALTGLDEQDW